MEKKTRNENVREDEISKMFVKFSDYLLKISCERETSLKRKDYEALLKIAVENLSFVHSGSVLTMNEAEEFCYIATYNHDYELLKNVRFRKQEILMRRFKQTYVIKRRSLDLVKELSSKIDEDDNSLKQWSIFTCSSGDNLIFNIEMKCSIDFVKAKAQSDIAHRITAKLSNEENEILRRGRNAKSNTMPKNAEISEYKYATGLEALIGYLYLKKDFKRLDEVLKICVGIINEDKSYEE